MIEREITEVEYGREQKRRGYAYLQRTQLSKTSQEMTLKRDLVMRNRPGIAAKSENVFEQYVQKPPAEGTFNYMFIGRSGLLSNPNRNVNYHETTVTDVNAPNTNFGSVIITDLGVVLPDQGGTRVLVDGKDSATDATVSGVNPSSLPALTGTQNGGIQFVYTNTSSGNITGLSIDKDGISMFGLPTSSSGLKAGAIWSDGGTLKIVT